MTTKLVDIKANVGAMAELEFRLRKYPKEIDKVIKRAAKRAATHGQSKIAKEIRTKSNIKSGITKEKMSKGASGKLGSFVRLEKTGRLGVRNFKAKQTTEGVKYQIGKKDKWLMSPSAFQGPRVGVMNRKWKGNAAKRVGKKRLPIIFLKGVSPAGFFSKRKLLKPSKADIQTFYEKRLRQEIRFVLMRKSKKK